MKPSFKTTALIAAICTTIYVVLCWLYHFYGWTIFEGHFLRWQYALKPFEWLSTASIVLMLATAVRSRIAIPKSNLFWRILSGVYVALFLSIVIAIINSFNESSFFWWNDRWYSIMYRYAYFYGLRYLGPATLWGMYIFYDRLDFQTNNSNPQQLKSISIIAWLIGGTLAFSAICTCIYLFLAATWTPLQIPEWSYLLPTWKVEWMLRFITYIALIYLFAHIFFPKLDTINQTRNSHCTPGSISERRFRFNRTLTLASVGSMFVFGLISFYMAHYRPLTDELIGIANSIETCAGCIAIVCILISWIMLNIMAITQLPNPREYKIFNLICHLLIVGGIISGIVIEICQDSCTHSSPLFDISVNMFLYAFLTFFITHTVRVIAYKLPTNNN